MGVYRRADSPYWWLFIETTKQKERTEFKVGETVAQRHDSRKLALDRYHQRMNEVAARLYRLPSAVPAIRFGKYADTYAVDVIAHRRGANRELELLEHLKTHLSDLLLSSIDVDQVRTYMTARRGNPHVSARTVNREVDLLKTMLRDAVPKYLSVSPIAGMKRLPVVPPKRRQLTSDEEARLLAIGDAEDCAIIIVAMDTLMRLGDLLDVRREDRAGSWLYVANPKSGAPYEVALSPRAAAALDAIDHDGRYYFAKFRRALNPRDWPGSVRQRLELLCRRAGLPYGRTIGGITFHWGTRRTGATRLLIDKGVPLPVVQLQGNWKQPDVLLGIYAEAHRDDLLKAVGAFPKRSRAKRKAAK